MEDKIADSSNRDKGDHEGESHRESMNDLINHSYIMVLDLWEVDG